MRDVSSAARLIFNTEVDPLLVRVLSILASEDAQSRGLPYAEVVEVCRSSKSWDSVAQALVGTVAQDPDSAHRMVNELGLLFEPIGVHSEDSSPTPQFAMGALLGLFLAGVWIDDNWGTLTDFEECLPDRFPEMILSAESMMTKAGSFITKEYEQELSRAIKTWTRPEDGHVARRMVQYQHLVRNLYSRAKGRRQEIAGKPRYTKLEELMFDQLAYAWIGSISPLGRLGAAVGFFDIIFK